MDNNTLIVIAGAIALTVFILIIVNSAKKITAEGLNKKNGF
jgi:hypothetical protein